MSDLISRQAAMDEMSKQQTYKMFVGEDTVYLDANDVGSVLASLPSAGQYTDDEIQRMQDIEQAQIEKAYDLGYAEGKADAEPHWIPCSERLPDEREERYWCCSEGGYQFQCRWTNDMYGLGANEYSKWGWHVMDKPQYSRVIAWMPLPEPYKEKES